MSADDLWDLFGGGGEGGGAAALVPPAPPTAPRGVPCDADAHFAAAGRVFSGAVGGDEGDGGALLLRPRERRRLCGWLAMPAD